MTFDRVYRGLTKIRSLIRDALRPKPRVSVFRKRTWSLNASAIARRASVPLVTASVLVVAAAAVVAVIFSAVHFQKKTPLNIRQGSSSPLDSNATDSPSALAAQRLTTHGRQKLDQALTARLATNPTMPEASKYIQGRSMLFEGLVGQLEADAALFETDFTKKSCAPAAELRLASTSSEISSFQESHFYRLSQVKADNTVRELLSKDYVAASEAINKVYVRIYFRVADAALKANCLELANQLYKKVVPVASTVEEMLRAQTGIQNSRQLSNR